MGDLTGRIALITGATRGIGLAIARKFAEEGATLLLTDVLEPGDNLPDGAHFIHLDVTSEADWGAAMDKARELSGLDILVNNAGVAGGGPIEMMEVEEYRRIMSINMDGVFLGTRAALPLLKERAPKWKGGASIINMSSIYGKVGGAAASAYSASKGAVKMFTKSCAAEFAGLEYGIRVNSIHPGFIETNMVSDAVELFEASGLGSGNEARNDIIARHPVGRLGYPEEIAEGALYLASDRSSFSTGSELVIDGGLTAI